MMDKQEIAKAQSGGKLDLDQLQGFFVDRFTPKYQEVREKMNLAQIRHTGSLKAYMCNLNAQMSVTLKMDKFGKKCILLDWL
jgi:hypothetical protein